MICQFCKRPHKLVKAHIIPEGFFRRLREDQDPLHILSSESNTLPKRSPIGVYDREILCEGCEKIFGPWDEYAQDLLGKTPKNAELITRRGETLGYKISDYKYSLLKLFFISLLWRASVSKQNFYSRINLGPFEAISKNLLEQNAPTKPEEFSVMIAKFDHEFGKTMFDPHSEKIDGIKYYRFYLGGYIAYIKVDNRPTPKIFSPFIMKPEQPLMVIARNLEHSAEWSLMHKMVSKNPIS